MPGSAELETLFRAAVDAYKDRDADRLVAMFAEDGIMQDMSDPANPFVGPEAVHGFLTDYFSTLRNVRVALTSVMTSDNMVSGELEVDADYVAAPFSVDNPRPVHLQYCVVDSFRDGKIVRERFYWDSPLVEHQLAVDPA